MRAKSGAFGAVLLVGSEPDRTVQQVGRMGAVARGDTKMKKTTTRKQRKTHSEKMTDTSRDYRQTEKSDRKFVPDFYSLLRKK